MAVFKSIPWLQWVTIQEKSSYIGPVAQFVCQYLIYMDDGLVCQLSHSLCGTAVIISTGRGGDAVANVHIILIIQSSPRLTWEMFFKNCFCRQDGTQR